MSEINELWNQVKAGTDAEKRAALSMGAARNAVAPILRAFGKAPALEAEIGGALKAAPEAVTGGLGKVTSNIDEALSSAKPRRVGSGSKPPENFGKEGPRNSIRSGTSLPSGKISAPNKASGGWMDTLRGYGASGAKAWDGLTPGAKLGVKGTALAGGLGLSNMQGRSAGKETGMEIGSGQGYDAGIADANAMQSSMDPGVLGRLMEVFTGRQQSTINTSDPQMAARRQAVIQNILSGGR